ncbi:MAG: universal stress protein [Paenisporosarcina sp.]|uniref:universal stress protein n=1 Tax=Paenisporosarcina sp. TaxID=1932001 RepID=UPI003C7873CB
MFNKMIVGYDGSEGSRTALIHAVDLMHNRPNTSLIVAYVNDDVVGEDITYSNESVGSAPILNDMTVAPQATLDENSPQYLAREYAQQMTESIQIQLDRHHVDAQILAIDGQPARALANLAETEKADVIIVGNSGKSGFQKFFVGSVSEKIVKESPCTVIVVK